MIVFLQELIQILFYKGNLCNRDLLRHVETIDTLYDYFNDNTHGSKSANGRLEEVVVRLAFVNFPVTVDELKPHD